MQGIDKSQGHKMFGVTSDSLLQEGFTFPKDRRKIEVPDVCFYSDLKI